MKKLTKLLLITITPIMALTPLITSTSCSKDLRNNYDISFDSLKDQQLVFKSDGTKFIPITLNSLHGLGTGWTWMNDGGTALVGYATYFFGSSSMVLSLKYTNPAAVEYKIYNDDKLFPTMELTLSEDPTKFHRDEFKDTDFEVTTHWAISPIRYSNTISFQWKTEGV